MDGKFDTEQLAATLAATWRSGLQRSEPREIASPPTLADGYDVQDRMIALLGHPVVGWKIGMSGRNGYLGAGLTRPIFGHILAPRCFASGDVVPVAPDIAVTVELEVALVIADDVDPNGKITPDLIRSAHLGFEIVSSRMPGHKTFSPATIAADNGISHAVVLGDAVDFHRFAEMAADAQIAVNDAIAARGLKGDDLPDPLSVLGHLIAHLAERGKRLKRGDIVFTGTLTKPFGATAPCSLTGGAPQTAVRCRLESMPTRSTI
jgi:2-keto-4-pentenoate hydratase